MDKTKHTIDLWTCVNKNGFINMSFDEPKKNEVSGKWEMNYPFVNSIIYTQIKKLIEHSRLTWNNEPEFFTIQY